MLCFVCPFFVWYLSVLCPAQKLQLPAYKEYVYENDSLMALLKKNWAILIILVTAVLLVLLVIWIYDQRIHNLEKTILTANYLKPVAPLILLIVNILDYEIFRNTRD